MCGGGFLGLEPKKPKAPPAPPPPPEPVITPTKVDPEVTEAGEREKKRGRLARGRKSTILTGGQGVTGEAPVEKKTLLGA